MKAGVEEDVIKKEEDEGNTKEENDGITISNTSQAGTVVVFIGDVGAGKSTLCNSIFQKDIFESGVAFDRKTAKSQDYFCENIRYVDTPGLTDFDLIAEKGIAKQIEDLLKEGGKYKIVFVSVLESGRIKVDTIKKINAICEAIKADFEYGIIFNKGTPKVEEMLSFGNKEFEDILYEHLKRRPCRYIVIGEEVSLKDADNRYFSIESENRKKLIKFIDELPSCEILPDRVGKIIFGDLDDVLNEKFVTMQSEYTTAIKELSKEVKKSNKKIETLKKQVESTNQPDQPGFISSVMKQVINFGSRITQLQFRNPALSNTGQRHVPTLEKIEEE